MTITNQNLIKDEIKRRLNSGNACYHSVHNHLSSCLLAENIKIRTYKTIILPVVLYGCETWFLTLREAHRLWVFENRVLRRIFGPKRDEVTGGWRKLQNCAKKQKWVTFTYRGKEVRRITKLFSGHANKNSLPHTEHNTKYIKASCTNG
jgi:hypothetical protein